MAKRNSQGVTPKRPIRRQLTVVLACIALAGVVMFLAVRAEKPRAVSRQSPSAAKPSATVPTKTATRSARAGTEAARPATPAPSKQTPLQAQASLRFQVQNFLRQMEAEASPVMAEHARGMLGSTSAVLRAAGAILLAKAQTLDERDLEVLANHDDLSVPLTALEWLRDSGRFTEVDVLGEKMQQREIDVSAVVSLLKDGGLRVAGGRLSLDMLKPVLAPDKAHGLYLSLAHDKSQDYGLRMKSAMYLRDVVPFDAYRQALNDMTNTATQGETLWADGLQRLAERLEGPAEVADAPPSLSLQDVDSLLARENPTDLEDLALEVEYVVSHANSRVSAGTAARLAEGLVAMKEDPLSEDDRAAFARVEQMMGSVSAIEQARPAPPLSGPPPILPDDDESDGG